MWREKKTPDIETNNPHDKQVRDVKDSQFCSPDSKPINLNYLKQHCKIVEQCQQQKSHSEDDYYKFLL